MEHAAEHGYPVPAVYRVEGPELEMERLYGPTMLSACLDADLTPEEASATLVNLHKRLHELPSRIGPGRLLHMDLHPGNVILTERGPVVIDWSNTREGDPDLDLAVTALLLAMVSLTGSEAWSALAKACLPHYVIGAWGDPTRLLEEAVATRRKDLNMSAKEIAAIPEALALIRRIG